MTLRTPPAEDDVFRYDLTMQYGWRGSSGPTLQQILVSACAIGGDEAIHDDVEHANEYAGICELFRPTLERNPTTLTLSVKAARRLHAACLSAWSYADQNNYGADDEPDPDARNFGAHGRFMLGLLAHPWRDLSMPDDGSHYFTRVQETS